MSKKRDAEDEAGYCKPPKSTQFKKGKSGNPKGRPTGSLNFAIVLARALRETVVINEKGKRSTITKLEATTKQLVNKAASGDLNAIKLLSTLVAEAEQRALAADERPAEIKIQVNLFMSPEQIRAKTLEMGIGMPKELESD